VFVLFFLERFGILDFVKTPLQTFFLPAQVALKKSGSDIASFFQTVGEIGGLRATSQDLEVENAFLKSENAALKKVAEENKVLKEQLGVNEAEQVLILARVVGYDPFLTQSRLILDKGNFSGVEEKDLVVVKNNLIGQVVSVNQATCQVRLLSDPETKLSAITEGRVKGLLVGEFGTGSILERVVQGSELKEGEIVFTLGEADFPAGLVLGKIKRVFEQAAEPFKRAAIEPIVGFSQLETVFILKLKDD
jgi:rod shape-determining protein MreC